MSRGDAQAPMRIVHLIDSLAVGGTELHVLKLTRAMRSRSVPVRVVCIGPEGPLAKEYAKLGVDVQFERVHSFKSLQLPARLRAIGKALDEDATTVVHAHDIYSNVVGALLASRSAPWRLIVSQRWGRPDSLIWRLATRFAFFRANAVVANSPGTASIAVGLTIGDRNKVVTVENFIEPECFGPVDGSILLRSLAPTLAPTLPGDPVVLGYVGRLAALKRVEWMISAVSQLRLAGHEVVLIVVGDGPEKPSLVQQVESLGLKSAVFFAGERERLPLPHSIFDISLLASTTEGTPNTLVEAMACGSAVVATDVGGVASIVEHGRTGLLCEPTSLAPFVKAVESLVVDASRRKGIGARARQVALTRWSEEIAMSAILALYERQ